MRKNHEQLVLVSSDDAITCQSYVISRARFDGLMSKVDNNIAKLQDAIAEQAFSAAGLSQNVKASVRSTQIFFEPDPSPRYGFKVSVIVHSGNGGASMKDAYGAWATNANFAASLNCTGGHLSDVQEMNRLIHAYRLIP